MTRFVFTAAPEASVCALNELTKSGVTARLEKWLAPGVGLVVFGDSQASCQQRIAAHPPVFIRHLFPVQTVAKMSEEGQSAARCAQQLAEGLPALIPDDTFAVQVRLFASGQVDRQWPWTRHDLANALTAAMQAHYAAPVDVRHPLQVVSVVCVDGDLYAGVSRAADNLSGWPGGESRYAKQAGFVSRAEFKLLEAIEVFALELPPSGRALDLGAAPGGWTRVLIERGLQVTAVDPARLAAAVASDPGVRHEPVAAQLYLRRVGAEFDIVVNDMKMDARASVSLMIAAARALRPGGLGVMTLKLPDRAQERIVASSLDQLRTDYEVLGARQLFHNRSEVTVALRRL